MLSIFKKIEDVLVQLMRVVLMVFSLLVMIGMGMWAYDKFAERDGTTTSTTPLDWSKAKPDLQFVLDETRRDMGQNSAEYDLVTSLTDPALRPSLQKADALLRQLINQNPTTRALIEKENNSRGEEEIHPLLQGDAMPTAEQIDAYKKEQLRKEKEQEEAYAASVQLAEAAYAAAEAEASDAAAADAAAVDAAAVDAAAEAVAADAAAEEWMSEPVNLPKEINDRANMAELEHGKGARTAYIQGLPAALEKIVADADLSKQLQKQPVGNLVNMLLVNYTMTFDRSAMQLSNNNSDESIWDRSFAAVETAFWSMLMSFLVLVVMVISVIRMERHLRVISDNSQR